jgi:hypothetical protein
MNRKHLPTDTSKSKITDIEFGSSCPERCTVCAGPCLGGPPRYVDLHTCLDLHQWQTGTAVVS